MPIARLQRRLRDDPRLARMLRGGLSTIFARGVSLAISLVSIPLTVRYLGRLEYGVWVTLSSTVIMLGLLDLGIANTLTNLISEAFAADDRPRARAYYATAFWLNVVVAAVLALLAFTVWHLIDWAALLHLSDPELARQARLAVGIALVYFTVAMPLNLAPRVLGGFQQVHVASYFAMLNSVLGLVAILVIVALHGNLVQLMTAFCLAILTGSVSLNLWLIFSKPWIRPSLSLASAIHARSLFRQGFLFFVLQLTNLVFFNSDNLVISHYLGAGEVTPYSVAWRLINYACLLQALLIPSFWPAFAEAYHKRDMEWVRNTYNSVAHRGIAAVTIGAILLGLSGRTLIRLWAGPTAVPNPLLLWTMVFYAVVAAITTNQNLLLTATGRLRLQAGIAATAAAVNLWLSIVLVKRIGAEGVILATIYSFGLVIVLPQARAVRKVLRGDYLEPLPIASPEVTRLPS